LKQIEPSETEVFDRAQEWPSLFSRLPEHRLAVSRLKWEKIKNDSCGKTPVKEL